MANKIGFPCPYMRNNKSNWITCDILTQLYLLKHPDLNPSKSGVLCAWICDLGDPLCGEPWELLKKKAQQNCPKHYSWDRMDAKVQLLIKR